MEFEEEDRQTALVELKSRFPAATGEVQPAAVPQLKSAKHCQGAKS